jgi:hypothetical protein
MRAKLQDGQLVFPQQVSQRPDGTTVVGYPQREDLLIADGWKTVVDAPKPSPGLYNCQWVESADAITRTWTLREQTDFEKAWEASQAEREAQAQAWLAEHTAKVEGLRTAYRAKTRALCKEAGIKEADILTAEQMDTQLFPLLDDAKDLATLKRNVKLLAHTIKLLHLTMLLRAEDMPDALDRI